MILERTVLLFVVGDRPSRTAVTMPILAVRSVALVLMEKQGHVAQFFIRRSVPHGTFLNGKHGIFRSWGYSKPSPNDGVQPT